MKVVIILFEQGFVIFTNSLDYLCRGMEALVYALQQAIKPVYLRCLFQNIIGQRYISFFGNKAV